MTNATWDYLNGSSNDDYLARYISTKINHGVSSLFICGIKYFSILFFKSINTLWHSVIPSAIPRIPHKAF
jgi:hypothetical protein